MTEKGKEIFWEANGGLVRFYYIYFKNSEWLPSENNNFKKSLQTDTH